MKPKSIPVKVVPTPHERLLVTFSELSPLQVALLLDCVMYATTDTGYIDGNDDLNALKEGLSASLAMHVVHKSY
jgi:hypothetical protein